MITRAIPVRRQHSHMWMIKRTGYDTPLHRAVLGEKADVSQVLLDTPVIEIAPRDGVKYTPLHTAALGGSEAAIAIVEHLLQLGCKVDLTTPRDNATPLHVTTMFGNLAMVKLLVAAGADCELRSTDGRTALNWAEYPNTDTEDHDRNKTIEYLMSIGAPRGDWNPKTITDEYDLRIIEYWEKKDSQSHNQHRRIICVFKVRQRALVLTPDTTQPQVRTFGKSILL